MNLNALMLSALIGAGVITGGWLWHRHEVSAARQAGYDAAVMAGEKQRTADAAAALAIERENRELFRIRDEQARQREDTYAQALDDAQRRMRAGTDRLRCPASTVQPAAAPADGPVASGAAADEPGTPVVPEVAGDILGLAGDTARLVRKYDDLTFRLEACRALNNGPVPKAKGGAAD